MFDGVLVLTVESRWIDPKQEAVDDFNTYGDEIMQRLVWSGGCKSWYVADASMAASPRRN